ncbi:MAG TPA: VanZ family protein [Planctomycetota bacterium]|nr:VanZ family protein [Planctomycetota bacterium]
MRTICGLLALGWAGLLLFLGSRPADDLPKSPLLELPGADKILHLVFYGVLGALVARAAAPGRRRAALLGALAGLLCGMLDEWVQGHVPGRTRSWADLLADVAGALSGGFLARFRPESPSATMPGSRSQGEGS